MVVNDAIQAAIRDHRFEQVYSPMQIGASSGMHTFDDSLLHLAIDEALLNARRSLAKK